VDCDAQPELAKRFNVGGFPSVKIFPAEKTTNPYTKVVAKVPVDYTGPRTGMCIPHKQFPAGIAGALVTWGTGDPQVGYRR
jgi:hypothetical protein